MPSSKIKKSREEKRQQSTTTTPQAEHYQYCKIKIMRHCKCQKIFQNSNFKKISDKVENSNTKV